MSETIKADICVIGAGSGGLSVAAGAARMGADVVLIEKGAMGGDCLNTGCVPSKALIAAAAHAQAIREAGEFGLQASEPLTDWEGVHRHVHEVMAAIAPNDSQARFEGLGVRVIRAAAAFVDKGTVQAGAQRIRARYFVIAIGSSPFVPPLAGLNRIPYFTNETLFEHQEPIGHLAVIGGGPIGMEMAQAFRRLGARVTVFEANRLLPKDDPTLTRIVIDRMAEEDVAFYEGVEELRVAEENGAILVSGMHSDGPVRVKATHLLVATGRRANVEGLNLQAAGVNYSPRGIDVDARLRSSNRRIYAVGDVAGPYQFTHMASYQAGIVLRNILFRWPVRVDYRAVPWVTYTDPELAHVGLSEAEARRQGKRVRVESMSLTDNDRAWAERRTEGRIKVVTDHRGRILGATIVGLHAGELIQPWGLAITRGIRIGGIASLIAPYPTMSEINKRVAGSYFTDMLFSDRVRRLVRLLMWFTSFRP
jgi:pyruvate/2-oxoglutarate dehydrogenase complex dihydrolipoamide dehydrogenase (E3) component